MALKYEPLVQLLPVSQENIYETLTKVNTSHYLMLKTKTDR